ncbi:MAG: 2-oxoglutarate dehydrogenase complex dihydrolipoyllysine-residue succinyltransferase [Phycisphaerae bacterium]
MAVELKIPQAGESITQVQIGGWLKAEGDYVHVDEPVAEIETDKASMELPAPASGRITKLLKQVGEVVPVGAVICLIDETAKPPAGGDGAQAAAKPAAAPAAAPAPAGGEARVMPAARRALAEEGLTPEQVKATGPGGRLLKEDVQREVESRRQSAPASAPGAPAGGAPRQEEAVPMTMLRRRIAERLVASQQNAALLTTFNEIDMSAIMTLRKQRNEAFERKYKIKLGFMSFFVKAAIDALKQFPAVNAEIRNLPGSDGQPQPHVVYRNYYDIGVAVSTEQGLIVPVMRSAERLSFAEVEQVIADLAQRARERKITVDELQGGTFTISNGGVFGSLLSTPIVNPPQSAILGLHAIQERPVARDGQVVIRPMMYVALSYDHRIIDGRESVSFLKRIKECVEDPTRMLVEV